MEYRCGGIPLHSHGDSKISIFQKNMSKERLSEFFWQMRCFKNFNISEEHVKGNAIRILLVEVVLQKFQYFRKTCQRKCYQHSYGRSGVSKILIFRTNTSRGLVLYSHKRPKKLSIQQ